MPPASDSPRDLPDRIIRQALRRPANLRAFLHQVVPALADGFDCDRLRFLDREFPLDDWRRREADLPFEVPFRLGDNERPALVYILIEHQSAEDPAMPLRLLYFVVLYWERQWRAWEQRAAPKPPLLLNPVLPLVLYTGAEKWQNNRTLHDLLDEPAEFHGFVPEWGPLYWQLVDHRADELLESGDAWQQMLAVLRAQREEASEFERVYVEALRRLEALAEQDKVRWHELIQSILSWALWRRPRAEQPTWLEKAKASQVNVQRQREIEFMGQTIAEAIFEEGMAKGEAKGEVKGELKAWRQMLRQQLEERFGSLSEAVSQRMEAITDVEHLKAAVRQVLHITAPEELQL